MQISNIMVESIYEIDYLRGCNYVYVQVCVQDVRIFHHDGLASSKINTDDTSNIVQAEH